MTGFKKIHRNTYCMFKQTTFDFNSVDTFISKSGSVYHYTNKGVYRKSNHWGRVANCKWYLEGIVNYKNQNYYTGFALWEDFYDLNSESICFKLLLCNEHKKVLIQKSFSNTECLFTLKKVLKRKKQIEELLKSPKYLNYYNSPELAKIRIIEKLLTTKNSLSKIKIDTKNSSL